LTVIAPGASFSIANWSVSDAGTTVTLNENLTYAGKFSAGAGTTLDLSGGNLTLTGPTLFANDTFSGATTSGSHILHAKGYSTVSGLTIGGTTTFDNTGQLEQGGGDVTVGDSFGNAAKLVNGFDYIIEDDSGIGLGSSAASYIKNLSTCEKVGGAGTSAIAPEMVNSGNVYVSSGTLDFESAVLGKGTDHISNNSGDATLEFDNYVASGQTIDFLYFPQFTGGCEVDLTDPYGFKGQIAGFGVGDTVALSGDWSLVTLRERGRHARHADARQWRDPALVLFPGRLRGVRFQHRYRTDHVHHAHVRPRAELRRVARFGRDWRRGDRRKRQGTMQWPRARKSGDSSFRFPRLVLW
jgi:hypothetical protein